MHATEIKTAHSDKKLEDALMQLPDESLNVVEAWPRLPVSITWSRVLSDWLKCAVDAECDRRAMRSAPSPPLPVNDWDNPQLSGALLLSQTWCEACVDPLQEQFTRRLHHAMLAAVVIRLVPEPEETEDATNADDFPSS